MHPHMMNHFSAWFACYSRISTFIVWPEITSSVLWYSFIKHFLLSKNYVVVVCFFFLFITHLFMSLHENQDFSFQTLILYIHFLSNNSLISSWILTKYVSALLLCVFYQSYNFQLKANSYSNGCPDMVEEGALKPQGPLNLPLVLFFRPIPLL